MRHSANHQPHVFLGKQLRRIALEKGESVLMILEISYELRKPGKDYNSLYDTLKAASSWCHPMTSHWFIKTEDSVQTWADRLMKIIDQNDSLFVVDITGQPRQGWMSQEAWDWLNQNEYKKAFGY